MVFHYDLRTNSVLFCLAVFIAKTVHIRCERMPHRTIYQRANTMKTHFITHECLNCLLYDMNVQKNSAGILSVFNALNVFDYSL